MVKLLFDILITGHHVEYISHLVDYLSRNENEHQYVFIVHPDFEDRFSQITAKVENASNMMFVGVTRKEFELSQQGGLVRQSFNMYKVANKYALRYKAKHVCLLYFNIFQLPLSIFRPKYTVSGILFFQFSRMATSNWKEKLKYYRKYAITKGYTMNRRLKRIFVLNDEQTVSFLNQEFNTAIFKMLADPIPAFSPIKTFEIYRHYEIEQQRKIFLHIGSLSDRKGTFEFVKAAAFLAREVQEMTMFLLVGKTGDKQEEEALKRAILKMNEESNVTIVWDNQFVSNEMMKSLFDQCYAVVIPYKNAEASSGILGHAAASNKRVITAGKGLLKDIVETYNLGLLVEEVTPELVANKIELAIKAPHDGNRAHEFVRTKTVEHFAVEVAAGL